MIHRRQFLYLLGGFLAACAVKGREPDYTVVIKQNVTFDPASLVVPLGAIVAWHNQTDHVHTITADPQKAQLPARVILPDGAQPFDSGDLFSGEQWVYTFEVPGTYVYTCLYHEIDEMIGSVVVQD